MIFHCPVQISYVYLNEIKVVVVVTKKLEQPAQWMIYYNATAMPKKSQRLGATKSSSNGLEEEDLLNQ